MSDAALGFIGGLFCGGLLGFLVASLAAIGRTETDRELNDGVDDVLDDIDKKIRGDKNGKP